MEPVGAAAEANASRNARRERGRRARWAPARDALWALLDAHLPDGGRVAVVGAGNGDDLPLGRIAHRASEVALVDIDARSAARARSGVRRGLRRRIRIVEHDVTGGRVDRIVRAATSPSPPSAAPVPHGPGRLPGGRWDVVVGDLLYSQLLYPALLDAAVPAARRRATIALEGGPLTAAVVAALHASAPVVVHVHDPACWGNGYDQPVELDDVLDAADADAAAGLVLAGRAKGPRESDPRPALAAAGIPILRTALWHWPFVDGVDYLVVGTVAGVPPRGD